MSTTEALAAWDHKTYEDYCAYNQSRGHQVIPERLWSALKGDM